MKPKIPIVNEKDEIIDYKDRTTITSKDIYRVAGLWVTNNQGDILLARRAFTKTHDPGKWGPAVAGTVEVDETYKSNIIKEAEEELGLKNLDLIPGPKYLSRGEKWTHFTQVFFAVIDTELDNIKIDETEVAEVRWFNKSVLGVELSTRPQDFLGAVKKFFDSKNG
ncbi:NUDIX domain-containing protein [Patescibacteria group bacterium]|nr:NUDIX domain-containing protein [Patescibacteria group bacterium]